MGAAKTFLRFLSSNWSGVVKIDEFAAFLYSEVSEIMPTLVYIMTTIRSGFLLTPIRINFKQTCQVSRIIRETHAFEISRIREHCSRVFSGILL